ncbi:MAG: phosphatase PAP2 family protein [FCB group bacterium]|nr:phosphatase PAP2 family protein [FCB group bacterium]
MLNVLLELDKTLLIFINRTLSNPVFDFIMPLFDRSANFVIPLLIVWGMLLVKDRKNRLRLAVLIPLVILLSDQTGSFIKGFELRLRPWYGLGPDVIHHLGGSGGKHKSFPSNHAANISGVAVIFTWLYQKYKPLFWTVAGVIMFSRVYIGVHYPADVLAGAVIGIGYGVILTVLWQYGEHLLREHRQNRALQ